MSSQSRTEYYAERARQERERTQTASDASARRVHAEMANRYSALMTGREPSPSTPPPRG